MHHFCFVSSFLLNVNPECGCGESAVKSQLEVCCDSLMKLTADVVRGALGGSVQALPDICWQHRVVYAALQLSGCLKVI